MPQEPDFETLEALTTRVMELSETVTMLYGALDKAIDTLARFGQNQETIAEATTTLAAVVKKLADKTYL